MKPVLLLVFIWNSFNTILFAQPNEKVMRKQYKQYALCRCINRSFISDSLWKKDHSSAFMFEKLVVIPDLIKKIDAIVDKKISLVKKSPLNETKPYIYRCIELYESNILDSLISRNPYFK